MNILYEGKLPKKQELIRIELLGEESVDQIVSMQERVHRGMRYPSWFVQDTAEEIAESLERGGAAFGVYNERDQLIATRFISVPGCWTFNMASEIDENINPMEVVHLESTVVEEAYRGNRLQGLTLDVAMDYISAQGYRHLMSTVAPQNIFSLYNIMAGGLRIRALKKKYHDKSPGGVWRFILHRDLHADTGQSHESRIVPLMAFQEQSDMITEGFVGAHLFRRDRLLEYTRT